MEGTSLEYPVSGGRRRRVGRVLCPSSGSAAVQGLDQSLLHLWLEIAASHIPHLAFLSEESTHMILVATSETDAIGSGNS